MQKCADIQLTPSRIVIQALLCFDMGPLNVNGRGKMARNIQNRIGFNTALFALMVLISCWCAPLWAWSEFVHESICEQAYQRLSKPAKQLVLSLSQGENAAESYPGFAKSCVWADQVRHESHRATYEYHFINVPRGEQYVPQRDCAAHDCVTQAVQRYAIYLSDPKRRPQQRAEALRFLGHFVGDLHQPLHVGYKEDRGGNDIHVFWQQEEKTDRLHGLWDGRIPRDLGLAEVSAWQELLNDVSAEQVTRWSNLNLDYWAKESFELARDQVYQDTQGHVLVGGERLDEAYFNRAGDITRKRLQQAVIRLAYIIEQAANAPLTGQDFR